MDGFEREEQDFFFAYNMILDLPISEHAKIVYMCLCRFSDSDKKSFPSHASIGKKCSIKSRTTVIDAIDKLMEVGLLDYKTRKTSKGGQTSNLYFLYNKPNIEVQKKYQKLKLLKEKKKKEKKSPTLARQVDTPLSSRWTAPPVQQMDSPPVQQMDSPPVQQMDSPPVQQMDSPCSTDGQPPVQQMDTPCSADGHEVYPSKYIHLKNTQSINQDGQTDSHALQNLFKTIGLRHLQHAAQVPLVEAVISNLLQSGRVGKNTYSHDEMIATLENLTTEKMDAVLERYARQSQKRSIPSPFEYIKTCMFTAGKEKFNFSPEVLPHSDEKKPTYDMDEYTRLSMERLMGGQKAGDQKCPT